jgi:hypothetical protein
MKASEECRIMENTFGKYAYSKLEDNLFFFTVMKLKMAVFWVVALCSVVEVY